MGVPKGKRSKSNNRHRRAAQKLTMLGFSICPQCHGLKQPHHVCGQCGSYKGRTIVGKIAE
jgi:large subunit ribosomal protein L32